MRKSIAVLPLILLACQTAPSSNGPAKPVFYPMTQGQGLPFSAAVQVGDMLYLSGQIGADSTLTLAPGGIEAETRQAMENIRAAINRAGGTMDDIVKCTAMLADIRDWAAMNQVYVTYFPNHLPARSAFGTNGLAMGARVEIECVARLGGENPAR
ncbi:MAG: RidA family protein [Gemmatimonadales bacterium]